MTALGITRQHECGNEAVWETEHLFGFDVMWGKIIEGRYVPMVIVCRTEAVDDWQWHRARLACVFRFGGDFASATQAIADLAMEVPPTRVHRR